MNTLLVTYDRHLDGPAYVDLIVAIERSSEFVEVLDSGYMLRSDRSAGEVLDELLHVVGPDAPIVVLPVGEGAASSTAVPESLRGWLSA